MLNVLLLAIIFAVLLFLGFKLVFAYTMKITSIIIEQKHRDAEEILRTGLIPHHWLKKGSIIKTLLISGAAKPIALRRLQKIINYFQQSPLVEDESSREILLSKLHDVKTTWQSSDWQDIIPPQ